MGDLFQLNEQALIMKNKISMKLETRKKTKKENNQQKLNRIEQHMENS